MLKKGIKSISIILLLSLLQSCDSEVKKQEIILSNDYVKDNFSKYNQIYLNANDSVINYINYKLSLFLMEYANQWRIDSMICINSKTDKLIGVILSSSGSGKGMLSDAAQQLLGEKINNKWYFFKGYTLSIPRNMYEKNEMNPLSFQELSQIARKEMLDGSLVKNEKGEYIINDKWIDGYFYDNGFAQMGWTVEKNKLQYDSVRWFYIMDKWKHKIDTGEYKPFKKAIKEKLI